VDWIHLAQDHVNMGVFALALNVLVPVQEDKLANISLFAVLLTYSELLVIQTMYLERSLQYVVAKERPAIRLSIAHSQQRPSLTTCSTIPDHSSYQIPEVLKYEDICGLLEQVPADIP
jgi:hypothetical protein